MSEFKLVQTCIGCPEQYDVYDSKDNYVGYMRLRHGYFSVQYGYKIVYEASPNGDGIFEWEEREHYLNEGCKAIKAAMEAEREKGNFERIFEYA